MADITKCDGVTKNTEDGKMFVCPRREQCYRYTAKADTWRQSYFVDMPYIRESQFCEAYWDNKRPL